MCVDTNFYDYNIDMYELILKQLKNKLMEFHIPQVYYCNAGTIMRRELFEKLTFYSEEIFIFVDDDFPMKDCVQTIENGMYACIYTEDFEVLLRETGLCPEKINLPYLPTPELREELWNKLLALGGLRLTSSIPDNLEINASGAHKGAGLKALCRHLKISTSQVMAIGDNGNDVTMLQCAGVSVAVADALPEALAAAKYRTSAHDEDGLAEAVERFLIQQE